MVIRVTSVCTGLISDHNQALSTDAHKVRMRR